MTTDIIVKPSAIIGWWFAFDKISRRGNLGKTSDAAETGLRIALGLERAKVRRTRKALARYASA